MLGITSFLLSCRILLILIFAGLFSCSEKEVITKAMFPSPPTFFQCNVCFRPHFYKHFFVQAPYLIRNPPEIVQFLVTQLDSQE